MTTARPQRRNANRHSPRGMAQLERSIQSDGWIGAITIAADGETFDGSARLEVGASTGFDDALVVESDGTKPVIVKRTDIPSADDPRAVRLGIAANRVAQVNLDWDTDVLESLLADGVDLSPFWQEWELGALLGTGNANDPNAEWVGMPEFEQGDREAAYRVVVNFASERDVTQFEQLIGQTVPHATRTAGSIWFPKVEDERLRDYGYIADES